MGAQEIIKEAILLEPQDRYMVIESLVNSLDEIDEGIEKLWIEESEKRLVDYEDGNLETLSANEVFSKWS